MNRHCKHHVGSHGGALAPHSATAKSEAPIYNVSYVTNTAPDAAKKDSMDVVTVIPWLLALLPVLASLWLGKKASDFQKQMNRRQMMTEELKSLRDPVVAALASMAAQKRILAPLLSKPASDIANIRAAAAATEQPILEAYLDLSDALAAIDNNAIVNGNDWQSTAEIQWDLYNQSINQFKGSTDDITAKAGFDNALAQIKTLSDIVGSRLAAQYVKHIEA